MSQMDRQLQDRLYPIMCWGTLIGLALMALISPLIYLGMTPAIDWSIASRIFVQDSLPIWIALAVLVSISRRLFASKQTTSALALLLLAYAAAIGWALVRLA